MVHSFMQLWQNVNKRFKRGQTAYNIRRIPPYNYRYEEGSHSVDIGVELMMGNNLDLVIYASNIINWNPPYDHYFITDEKRELILKRLGEKLLKEKALFEINYDPLEHEIRRQYLLSGRKNDRTDLWRKISEAKQKRVSNPSCYQ